jgi:hypothetical protein
VIPWSFTGQSAPTPLSATFGSEWTQSTSSICAQLKSQIAQALVGQGYGLANWDACQLTPVGDLQAETWSNGALELRWVVRGNAIQFDVAAPTTPTVNATFDMTIDVTIGVAGQINAQTVYPLTLNSALVTFANANFSSSNIVLNTVDPSFAQNSDNTMNNTVVDLNKVPNAPDLYSLVDSVDSMLIRGAQQLFQALVAPSAPGAFETFTFSATIDPHNLTFNFIRGGTPPPAPTGCTYGADVPYQGVDAVCDRVQPAGVTELTSGSYFAELMNGLWTPQDSLGRPELFFGRGAGWDTVAVCSLNEWGETCGPSVTVYVAPLTGGAGTSPGQSPPPPWKWHNYQ